MITQNVLSLNGAESASFVGRSPLDAFNKEQVFAGRTLTREDCSLFPRDLSIQEPAFISNPQGSPLETFWECQNPKRPYLWANDSDTKRVLIVRPNCGMWACPACAQRNRRRWAKRIHAGIVTYEVDGLTWWLITLTMRGRKTARDFLRDVAIWRDGWQKLYLRMKRRSYSDGVPILHYALLPELAPRTQRLHVHMLANCSFGAVWKPKLQKWQSEFLKTGSAECGLGYIADAKPIYDTRYASFYASKYLGKSLGENDWPENFRRIRTSQGWPDLPPDDSIGANLNWNVTNERRISEIIEKFWHVGFDAINLNTGEVIEWGDSL